MSQEKGTKKKRLNKEARFACLIISKMKVVLQRRTQWLSNYIRCSLKVTKIKPFVLVN